MSRREFNGENKRFAEPSAVAPDAEVKLSIKTIAQLMTNVHSGIRATALGSDVMVLHSSRS